MSPIKNLGSSFCLTKEGVWFLRYKIIKQTEVYNIFFKYYRI